MRLKRAKKVFKKEAGPNKVWPYWEYNGATYRIYIPQSYFSHRDRWDCVNYYQASQYRQTKEGHYLHNRTGDVYDSLPKES